MKLFTKLFAMGVVGALVAGLTVALLPARADACECRARTLAESQHDAAAIFEGRVTEITTDADSGLQTVKLDVVRGWKGVAIEHVTVLAPSSSAACGYVFVKNTGYLVYASAESQGLTVYSCSRTRPIEEADEDLAALGMGVVTFSPRAPNVAPPANKAVLPPKSGGGCSALPAQSGDGTQAAFALLTLVLLRRRKAA